MNLKIYLILLHLFSSTLPISNNAGNSLNVLASTVNDSTSPINKISIITTALKTETCNASYCYKNIDREEKLKNDRLELIQLAKKAGENKTAKVLTNTIPVHLQRNRLISSSMIYGLLTLAGQKAERTQCYNELGQIYDGINRKEIWAIKGKHEKCIQIVANRFYFIDLAATPFKIGFIVVVVVILDDLFFDKK